MKKQVLGIFVSDIHFSEVAPVARSCEPDWLLAQKRYVDQLRSFQKKHNAPIFIAGDVFDKWNSSAHLINHILVWIAGLDIYAIPGNHDCPHHNYKQLGRSSYWTLVEANKLVTSWSTLFHSDLASHLQILGLEVCVSTWHSCMITCGPRDVGTRRLVRRAASSSIATN